MIIKDNELKEDLVQDYKNNKEQKINNSRVKIKSAREVQNNAENIRCSSSFIFEENRKSKENIENKEKSTKLLLKNNIKCCSVVKDNNQFPNFLSFSPYVPASNHKFREKDKKKWITKKDFSNI